MSARSDFERDGPKAAAWLVRTHRAHLHRRGCVTFRHPANQAIPGWMALALRCLELRKGWRVGITGALSTQYVRVTWLGWRKDVRRSLAHSN